MCLESPTAFERCPFHYGDFSSVGLGCSTYAHHYNQPILKRYSLRRHYQHKNWESHIESDLGHGVWGSAFAMLPSVRAREAFMVCSVCGSEQQGKFHAEIAIHFPGLQGLNKPIVWVFPQLLICPHCGVAQFGIPETELALLAEDRSPGAAR